MLSLWNILWRIVLFTLTMSESIGVKGYRVRAEKQNSPNVVTACVNIPWKINRDLQIMPYLKPGNWSNCKTENEIQTLMVDQIKAGETDFELDRYNYIC